MSPRREPQESNGFSCAIFSAWNREDTLAARELEIQEDKRRIKNLYTFSGAIGAVTLSSALLFLNTSEPDSTAEPNIPMCINSYQTAVEEASRTGLVQLVTVAGCEATILPPQTTTIP